MSENKADSPPEGSAAFFERLGYFTPDEARRLAGRWKRRPLTPAEEREGILSERERRTKEAAEDLFPGSEPRITKA